MKRIGLILVLITAILLSGCFPVLEQMEKRPFIPDVSRESDLEQIDDMIELRDYVLSQVKEGNLEFSFLYDGYEEIDPGLIAQMAGVCFVRVTQRGEEYDVELTQFPGDRIVDAYFNDDTSYLTDLTIKVVKGKNQLLEIITKASQKDVYIESVKTTEDIDYTTFSVTIKTTNSEQLDMFISDLKSLSFLIEVERNR